MAQFLCQQCGREFELSPATLAKYPGWVPKRCRSCRPNSAGSSSSSKMPRARPVAARPSRSGGSREENLSVAEVLAKYSAGPKDGVFTDGAAEPNPGPGGWGAVFVIGDRVVEERWGHEPHTTNNRMELCALLAGAALVPEGTPTIVYTDSQLCVSTINEWAKSWEARGWRRKGGEIKNLELVKEAYALFQRRPELELRWIAAHAGNRWNEYADALATAYRRSKR